MYLTRAFRHAGRFPSILFALAVLLATSCAHVRAQTPPPSAATGEQKTAVILVNFQGNATQPKTPAEVTSLVFGQVSDLYWEASYQKTFLSGETFGWFTIPVASSNCDIALIAQEGDRAATAAGANLAGYTTFVYMFPSNSGCGWSGYSNVGSGGQRQVFVNGTAGFSLYNVAHEIGHRFGVQHSDGWDCDASPLGNTCTKQGYSDPADVMGVRAAHFNAFQKERLGWLNAAGVPPITTVAASGRYAVAPMETVGTSAKALKILKSTDPVTGVKTWYYVEYRQPIGFDAALGSKGNLTSGLLVRTGTVSASGIGTSLLLDMTPNSSTLSKVTDFEDGALGVGNTFTDTNANVAITLVSRDANGAVVDVSLADGPAPAPTCTRAAPTVSLAGPTASVAAGTTVSYTVSVTNRDSSACSATTFALARSVPSGWTGTLAATSLALSPGASGSTSLSVTSPSTAAAGGYALGVGGSSSAGSVHTANAATTYTVGSTTSSLSDTVGTDKTSYIRGETVYVSARVLANGAPASGASVRFTLALPGGGSSVLNATSGSDGYARSTYKLGKAKSTLGDYQVRADASLGGASSTASSAFGVR
jgi:hypothetical protein